MFLEITTFLFTDVTNLLDGCFYSVIIGLWPTTGLFYLLLFIIKVGVSVANNRFYEFEFLDILLPPLIYSLVITPASGCGKMLVPITEGEEP